MAGERRHPLTADGEQYPVPQPGGGVRFRATYPVADLVALGYLEEMA